MSQLTQAPPQHQQQATNSSLIRSNLIQRSAITPIHHPTLQRCSNGVECPECRQKRLQREGTLQRAAVNSAPTNTAPPIVHDVLNSSGQPLDGGTRAFMEPRFGHDFSGVRIHTDARAAESARSVNALAYTVGKNVVFGTGQYSPGTSEGRKLLAHELTHVVQQFDQPSQSQLQGRMVINVVGDHYEQEAERMADTLTKNTSHDTSQQTPSTGRGQPVLTPVQTPLAQRQSQDMADPKPSTADKECPGYERDEPQVSHTEAGHLEHDVFMVAPGRLLIADFGVDWRHVKRSAVDDPLLQSWLNTFETDDSYRLDIIGYSDCVGVEGHNTYLRQSRSQRVEGLLGHKARSRVTFRGMAALGDYVADNLSVASRAKNRGVVIEFHQEFTMEPEDITGTAPCPKGIKTVTVDFVSLRGSNRNPPNDLDFANKVFQTCCVRFTMGSGRTAPQALSDIWLGGDTDMNWVGDSVCGKTTNEEINTFSGATSQFGLSSRFRVFYVASCTPGARGFSVPPFCATGARAAIRDMIVVTNDDPADRTLAHELGHILLNTGHSDDQNNLMHTTNGATGAQLTSDQCTTIFANA
jgi:outer membrane protein OmpA-like peptidoglycan-associated protein